MPDDAEFASYCRARWHVLVDSLVQADVPETRAREVVVDVLADLGRDWSRVRRDHEVDVLAWEMVAARSGLDVPPGSVAPRLGLTAGRARDDTDAAALVRARLRDRRRRRGWITGVALAVALVLAAVAGWWFVRPLPPEVVPSANPVPVPWYAEGRLHLADVTVTLDDVEAFVATAEGVAVRTVDGDLVLVAHDGTVSDLARAPEELDAAGPDREPLPHDGWLLDEVASPEGDRVGLVRVARTNPFTGIQLPQAEHDAFAFMLCDPGCHLVSIPGFPQVDVRLR